MNEIIVKEYEGEDKEGIVDLLRRTFPKTSNEATFKWRFETDNKNRPMLILAKHRDIVVSFCSWLPWEFCYKGKKLLGYQNGEAATDINYRGQGMLGKILNYANELAHDWEIDFLFCYTNAMSYGPTIKAGYYPIGVNYFYIRPINPLCKRVEGSFTSNSDYTFDSMLKEDSKITPIINHDYYKWRYMKNVKYYEIIEYNKDNGLAIFFIRRKKWKGLDELVLLDCHFNNYNEEFVKNSIRFLDKVFSRRAFYMRTFYNERADRGRALGRHFYIKIKSKSYNILVKPISNRIDKNILLNFNCWDTMPHCVDEL